MSLTSRVLSLMVCMSIAFHIAPSRAVTKQMFDVNAVRAKVQDTKSAPRKQPIKLYRVCSSQRGKSGLNEYCVDDFFSDTNVQMLQAHALAKLYAKKTNGHTVVCGSQYTTSWNDDYIRCADGKNAYEFRFDDVTESVDYDIKTSVAAAVCKMHGGYLIGGEFCRDSKSSVDCAEYNKDMASFGYSASRGNYGTNNISGCAVSYNGRDATATLRTAYGIDNNKFRNLQLRSSADMEFLLKRYASRQMAASGEKLTSWRCNNSFNTYQKGAFDKDDILTCYANNKPVDFVFDDMQESWATMAKGGTAGLNCIADAGGVFDGKNCSGLTRQQCADIGRRVAARWDDTLDTCILPDAKAATNLARTQETLTNVGIAVVFIGVSGLTAGSGTAAILVYVGAVSTGVGVAAQEVAKNAQSDKASELVARGAQCVNSGAANCAKCAPDAMKEYLRGVATYKDNLTPQLMDALDETVAGLYDCLDKNSPIVKQFNEMFDANGQYQMGSIADWDKWPREKKIAYAGDVLVAIGAALDIAGAVAGLAKSLKTVAVTGGSSMTFGRKLVSAISKKGVGKVGRNVVKESVSLQQNIQTIDASF